MKTAQPPIQIVKGKGTYLYDDKGVKYIDAISSWWVNVHGHAHPEISNAISEQSSILEQVIFAGFTHPKAIELANRLISKLPEGQEKIFFSDDGSTSVEVAIKMALQYWYNQNQPKTKIIALEGAYHGDTFGSMSVSERSAFTKPFEPLLFDVVHIPFPFQEKEGLTIDALNAELEKGDVAAMIVEPLVQGAAGMRMYSKRILNEIFRICKEKKVIIIADEVMTGFGRTGRMFAVDHIENSSDIMCLSKGLTGGFMALGVTSCTEKIYQAFLSGDHHKTFFHGHSFTANPIACASACASLEIFDREKTWENICNITHWQSEFCKQLSKNPSVTEARACGTILAVEIKTDENTSYFNNLREEAWQFFLSKNLIMRPLGNVIYVLPPYCISKKDISLIHDAIVDFIYSLSS